MTRLLRIGVIIGGRIVEERLLRERGRTELVPGVAFVRRGDRHELVAGGRRQRLDERARGKVTVGEVTVLYQMVPAPPVEPPPVLPRAVRGSITDRIDPRLALIETVSVLACLSIAVAAWLHDRPAHRNAWGGRIAQGEEIDTIDPEELAALMPVAEPGADDPGPAPEAAPAPAATPAPRARPRERASEATDAGSLQEEASRYAAALARDGAAGPDGNLDEVAPGGDLDQMIDETRAAQAMVELGGGSRRELPSDDETRKGVSQNPRKKTEIDGPESIGPKTEQEPKARIQIKKPVPLDETTLTPDDVLERIRTVYQAGLTRCYVRVLHDEPGARGKVHLQFTVNPAGRVTETSAETDRDALSTCIDKQMQKWTFPPPKDDEGTTSAAFKVTLALQPE